MRMLLLLTVALIWGCGHRNKNENPNLCYQDTQLLNTYLAENKKGCQSDSDCVFLEDVCGCEGATVTKAANDRHKIQDLVKRMNTNCGAGEGTLCGGCLENRPICHEGVCTVPQSPVLEIDECNRQSKAIRQILADNRSCKKASDCQLIVVCGITGCSGDPVSKSFDSQNFYSKVEYWRGRCSPSIMLCACQPTHVLGCVNSKCVKEIATLR